MPLISDHQSARTIKLLNIGDNGGGKTGCLAALANAGYKVFVADLDNGTDILRNLMLSPNSPYDKAKVANLSYELFTDPMRSINGQIVPAKATRWQRLTNFMDSGKVKDSSGKLLAEYPPLKAWTEDQVFVLDTMTKTGDAALDFVQALNTRLGQKPFQSDWGDAQELLKSLLEMLYDEEIKCNIIVNAHPKLIGPEGGLQKWYPDTPGQRLSPKVGSYFNTVVQTKTSGSGSAERHRILTKSTPQMELKTSNPFGVKDEYDIKFGMAELFADLRGQQPITTGSKT